MYLLQIWWSLVLWKWKYQFLYQFLKIPLKRLNSLPWSVILRYFQNQDHSKVPDRASRKTKRRKTHVITKRHAFHANAIKFFIKHQWTVACRSMEIKKFSACFAQWKTYLTEEKRYRENYRTEIPRERDREWRRIPNQSRVQSHWKKKMIQETVLLFFKIVRQQCLKYLSIFFLLLSGHTTQKILITFLYS